MSKKILFLLIVTTFLSNADKLTFSERASVSAIKGFKDGITGIAKNVVDINISKISNNIEQIEKEKKQNREAWKDREIKRLKKSVHSISAERYKYIHLYSQLKDKNRELKRKNIELEKFIKQHNIEKNNKLLKRAKAKDDLKKQLKGISKI